MLERTKRLKAAQMDGELGLGAYNCLRRYFGDPEEGRATVNDLANLTEDNLFSIRGYNRRNRDEIKRFLGTYGMQLKGSRPSVLGIV